jgi:hypothetical protein
MRLSAPALGRVLQLASEPLRVEQADRGRALRPSQRARADAGHCHKKTEQNMPLEDQRSLGTLKLFSDLITFHLAFLPLLQLQPFRKIHNYLR